MTSDSATLHGYTNELNPFNDSNLTQSFVWKKKIETELEQGLSVSALSSEERMRKQRQLAAEIEDVKRRRAEREEEKMQMDLMREQMERERAAEQVQGWEEKEEEFHRQQAKMKTKIRIRERREKAIDLLVKNVTFEQWAREAEVEHIERLQLERMQQGGGGGGGGGGSAAGARPSTRTPIASAAMLELQLTEPVALLSALPLAELLELRGEVEAFVQLKENEEYWKAIALVCDDEVRQCRKEKKERGVSAAVMREIDAMMKGKSVAELQALETQVHATLGEVGADVTYWGAVLMELQLCTAVAYLRELHADLTRRRLGHLKADREKRDRAVPPSENSAAQVRSAEELKETGEAGDAELSIDTQLRVMDMDTRNADHHLSPRLFGLDEELDIDVVSAADDLQQLHQQRLQVLAQYQPNSSLLHSLTTNSSPHLLLHLLPLPPLPPPVLPRVLAH